MRIKIRYKEIHCKNLEYFEKKCRVVAANVSNLSERINFKNCMQKVMRIVKNAHKITALLKILK